jgi:hypothetical protein
MGANPQESNFKPTETLGPRQGDDNTPGKEGPHVCAKPIFGVPGLILGFRSFLEICREASVWFWKFAGVPVTRRKNKSTL